MIDCAIPN